MPDKTIKMYKIVNNVKMYLASDTLSKIGIKAQGFTLLKEKHTQPSLYKQLSLTLYSCILHYWIIVYNELGESHAINF